ncbi:MAG: helix-turn-helix domain-containing protein [Candidatus Woesearchaeota archaeon]
MDLESIFSGSKWEIIKKLSEKSYSPIELSKELNTTVANISQQLKILEMAGIIKKERVQNHNKKGKPKTRFVLADDFAYIILLSKESADKKLIRLNQKQAGYFKNLMLLEKKTITQER